MTRSGDHPHIRRSPSHGRALLVLALPLVMAGSCRVLAPLMPQAWVSGQIALALLLTLPTWIFALTPPWCLAVGLWSRRVLAPLLVALPCAVLGGWVPLRGGPEAIAAHDELRLVSSNVNAFSDDPDRGALERALGALRPDVLVVIEKRALEVPGMVRVADNFGVDLPRESHATAIFCRDGHSCPAEVTAEFGSEESRMPLGLVLLPGDVCLLAIHAPPPVPRHTSGILPYVRRVADHIDDGRLSAPWGPCPAGAGALVVGDLNSVPGSPPWALLTERGLRDRLRWRGVHAASWPAGGGWPDLPFFQLDQVLVGQVEVGRIEHVRVPGADHKALVVEVGR